MAHARGSIRDCGRSGRILMVPGRISPHIDCVQTVPAAVGGLQSEALTLATKLVVYALRPIRVRLCPTLAAPNYHWKGKYCGAVGRRNA
jgi:hypothetical protein